MMEEIFQQTLGCIFDEKFTTLEEEFFGFLMAMEDIFHQVVGKNLECLFWCRIHYTGGSHFIGSIKMVESIFLKVLGYHLGRIFEERIHYTGRKNFIGSIMMKEPIFLQLGKYLGFVFNGVFSTVEEGIYLDLF